MQTLSIDIETYSEVDIRKAGMYKYIESPSFEVLLFAYAFNDEPVVCADLKAGEKLPSRILDSIVNVSVLKTAYNAAFERTALSKLFGIALPGYQWECTMARASMLGLPLGLESVANVLRLPISKMKDGKNLIRYFCVPCKASKVNGGRLRNMPADAPDKWETFKKYCATDVEVERAIRNKTMFFNIPESEKRMWSLDQQINDGGVLVDHKFVKNALTIDNRQRELLIAEAVELTQLDNPNSGTQLKKWLAVELDEEVKTLNKESLPGLLKKADNSIVKRVLDIRQELSKTSIKKYATMYRAMCDDYRVRGLLQYYGANRTGRWAGRLVQVQNLTKNTLADLDLARRLVKAGNLENLQLIFGNVSHTLSQLIRTSFIAAPGHRFLVADFSAIEARVIAWLAGEQWRLNVFNTHGKIYEASAAQMFKVPIESVTKGSDLRQRGKVSELALGYQGGPNALIKMGALDMGLQESELKPLVDMWRNANKKIVNYWQVVNDAALETVMTGHSVSITHGIRFFIEKGPLFIELPSGRRLSYMRPKIKPGKFGGDALIYEGTEQGSKKWGTVDTYGGKLVENIVQAVARDCLAEAMLRLHDAGYRIAMHVHDEVVLEMPYGKGSTDEVNEIMGTPLPWAKGLPLKADSYEIEYYKKD